MDGSEREERTAREERLSPEIRGDRERERERETLEIRHGRIG